MTTVRVAAGAQPYDVIIGPLERAADRLEELARGRPLPLVTDEQIWSLHHRTLPVPVDPLFVPEGEAAKSWAGLERLLAELARRPIDRSTPIVALGGGSVGDLTGLAASLFMRGCPVIHVPTTLLALADSAVGGKTAIDFAGEKNLVGSFHQPSLVLADPAFLATLDDRQRRAGYAEVVKYGLIDDPAFFAWSEGHGAGLLAGHRDDVAQAIASCVAAKARMIEGDVEDRGGRRALLNLGHSFAHAIEAEAGLGRWLHGEAVAVGLVLAFRFSADLGLAPAADADRVAAHLSSVGLPTRLDQLGMGGGGGGRLLDRMRRDKKNDGGQLALILARGIGQAFLDRSVDPARLAAFLDRVA